MARLIDSFSETLLQPFKSKFTCINNHESTKLIEMQQINLPARTTFTTVFNHPQHVRDIFVTLTIRNTSAIPVTPGLACSNAWDMIGAQFFDMQFRINNHLINTVYKTPTSLNRIFYKCSGALEEAVFGKAYCPQQYSNFSNSQTVQIQWQCRELLHKTVSNDNSIRVVMPLGIFCDFFNQDTCLPDNTEFSFSFANGPVSGRTVFSDNFSFRLATDVQQLNISVDLSIPFKAYYFQKKIAPRAFPYAETIFKAHWREMHPLHTFPFTLPTNSTFEANVNNKISIPFNQIPEFLMMWINYGNLVNYDMVAPTLANHTDIINLDNIATFGNNGRIIVINDANFNTNFLNIASYFTQITNFKLAINSEEIFDYQFKKCKMTFRHFLFHNNFSLEDHQAYDEALYASPFLINLTTAPIVRDIFEKISSGIITVEYTISKNPENQLGTSSYITLGRPYQFNIWASQQRELSIDSYRRTY